MHLEKTHASNSTKSNMKDWLTWHGIPFHPDMVKGEFYYIVETYNQKFKTYLFHHILQSKGHFILRHPYHPELNSIEMIRSEIKRMLRKNHNLYFKRCKKLMRTKILTLIIHDWVKDENTLKELKEDI